MAFWLCLSVFCVAFLEEPNVYLCFVWLLWKALMLMRILGRDFSQGPDVNPCLVWRFWKNLILVRVLCGFSGST